MTVFPFRPHQRRSRLRPGPADDAGSTRGEGGQPAHWPRRAATGAGEPTGVSMPERDASGTPLPSYANGFDGRAGSAGAELIVLVDMHGEPIGTAPKLASHHRDTPLHLAFSSYVFDPDGRLLVTRRARTKKTWPGIWTNSCCGHPGPGEPVADAVRRRLHEELGLTCGEIVPLLPEFRYCAELDGVVENEICPVFGLRVDGEPEPDPDEVEDYRWMDWDDFVAGDVPGGLSPWAELQVAELVGHPVIARLRTPLS